MNLKFLFISLFFLSSVIYTNTSQSIKQDDLYNILNDYRKGNLANVKSILEKYLLDKDYWLFVLKNKNTDYGYYESIKYLFLATKYNEVLKLLNLDTGEISSSNAIFGANKNDKMLQGDLATPIGVYDLPNKLTKLDQYYGPLAFTTSYPNLYDRISKKTGYGIWIHGLPLSGDREKNTKGCIAIDNALLKKYENTINYHKSLLITSNSDLTPVSKDILAVILSHLYKWRDAWINNDFDTYISFYNDDFTRFDGMKINDFKRYKKRVFDKKETKIINFNDINIAPYPNVNGKSIFRVTFLEDYKSLDSGYRFNGVKELYITVNNDKMGIFIEK